MSEPCKYCRGEGHFWNRDNSTWETCYCPAGIAAMDALRASNAHYRALNLSKETKTRHDLIRETGSPFLVACGMDGSGHALALNADNPEYIR